MSAAWPCSNYSAPATCLTAPSSVTGRCDFCASQAAALLLSQPTPPAQAEAVADCGCWKCLEARGQRIWFMILCALCGNKRCPHAADHALDCTGSNDPGQSGSAYEHGSGAASHRRAALAPTATAQVTAARAIADAAAGYDSGT